jgi:hypothetical protein
MKTIKYNKDKTVLLNSENILTRIIDLKGGNWNECIRTKDNDGKTTFTPVYPTYYKIGDYYYV